MEEITLLEMISNSKKYDLRFEDTVVLDKVIDIYFYNGAKIVAFLHKKRIEEVSRSERRNVLYNLNRRRKRRSLSFFIIWIAVQYESACDHRYSIPDNIEECKCYGLLDKLLSDGNFGIRGKDHREYKLKVKT